MILPKPQFMKEFVGASSVGFLLLLMELHCVRAAHLIATKWAVRRRSTTVKHLVDVDCVRDRHVARVYFQVLGGFCVREALG